MPSTRFTGTLMVLLLFSTLNTEFAVATPKTMVAEFEEKIDEVEDSETVGDRCRDYVYIDYDNTARLHRVGRVGLWNWDLCFNLSTYLIGCRNVVFCDGSINPINNLGGFAEACWGDLPTPPVIYPPGQNGCGNPRCQFIGDFDSKIECICNSHSGGRGLPGLWDNDCPESGYADCSDGRSFPCWRP